MRVPTRLMFSNSPSLSMVGKAQRLAQSEGRCVLVGGDERHHVIAIDATVLMGMRIQRDVIDARDPPWTPRSVAAVDDCTPRQMPPDQGDLLLEEIEVVEKPGLGRQDPLSLCHGG